MFRMADKRPEKDIIKYEKEVTELETKFGVFVRSGLFEVLFMLVAVWAVFYVSGRMGEMLRAFLGVDLTVVIFTVLAVLMLYMLLYIKSEKVKKASRKWYEGCCVVVCFLLYLTIGLIMFEAVRWMLGIHDARMFLVPVVASFFVTLYGFTHAKDLKLKTYDIHIQNAQKKKIVLLSDIHAGTFVNKDQLHKIVEMVNAQDPDIVLIAGDMFDVGAFYVCDRPAFVPELQNMHAKDGVYAILGNHDPAHNEKLIYDFYEQCGIKLLVDETCSVDGFLIVGRDDSMTDANRCELAHLTCERNNRPVIVMDHNPTGIAEAIREGVDLIVCGHTHKGQFFPADIFTRLAYGKKDYYGMYHRSEKTVSVVTSGVGYFGMPMRIGSDSEVVVLNIK